MGKHQYKGLNDGGRGIPALIVDLLETSFGRWHTIDELVGMVELHRPEKAGPQLYNTVTRALHRMIERGVIEHRMSIDPRRNIGQVTQVRCDWRDYWHQEEIA